MRRCVVNVAVGGNYAAVGQPRLMKSLAEFEPVVPVLAWKDSYPPDSPKEEEVPRAFKLYAIREARKQGYEQVLWLDATTYLIDNIRPIWRWMTDIGYYLPSWPHPLKNIAPAEGLAIMDCPEPGDIDTVLGGCVGIDFTHQMGRALYDAWWLAMKAGAHVGPDGRDETPLSILAHRWRLIVDPQPGYFTTWEVNQGRRCIQFRGV